MLGKDLIMQTLLGGGSSGGEKTVVILPETNMRYIGTGFASTNPLNANPTEGATAVITCNGVEYTSPIVRRKNVGSETENQFMLGKVSIYGESGGNNDCPFVVLIYPDGNSKGRYVIIEQSFQEGVDSWTNVTLSIIEKPKPIESCGVPQEDIDAAFAALAEKGVTIPDGATSADLDDLIASIVAGGGGDVKMTSGTVSLAQNYTVGKSLSTAYNVEHNLGEVPDIFVFSYSFMFSWGASAHLKLFAVIRADDGTQHPFSVAAGSATATQTSSSAKVTLYGSNYFGENLVTENAAKVVGYDASTFLGQDASDGSRCYKWVALKYRT